MSAAPNQPIKSQCLDRLAFSYLRSSKKYETPSEYNLGGGLFLTTDTRPLGLHDFPFGIRYNKAYEGADLKTNLLIPQLDQFEILRLQGLGLNSPKYYQMSNGFSVFAMTSANNSQGFYQLCGTLMFTDRYHRTIIPTFETVMLLIAACQAVPYVIRSRARDAIKGAHLATCFRHSQYANIDHMINLLGNTPGESSSKTTNDKYQPQSGEISSPCLDVVQTCSEGIKRGLDLKLNEFMTQNTALMPGDLTSQSIQAFVKIFTFESKLYSLAGVFFLYVAFRVLRDLVLTIHFAAGLLTGLMYTNKQKLFYVPQTSGFDFKDNTTKSEKPKTSQPQVKKTVVSFGGKEPLPDPKVALPEQAYGSCAFGPAVANAYVKPRLRKSDDTFFGGFGTGI